MKDHPTAGTTEHPDDGRLQSYLDRELTVDAHDQVERHLLRCDECSRRIDELEALGTEVRETLGLLDPEAPTELDGALWEIRRRRAQRRSNRHRQRLVAAAVVLLFAGAGAAVALPGSPVRSWLANGGEPAVQPLQVETAQQGAVLRVALAQGAARVEMTGVGPDGFVEVQLTSRADVEVEGPPEASFRTGAGWVEVSGADGPVRIRIPEGAREVEIQVEGRVAARYLEGRLLVGDEVVGPVPVEADDEWLRVHPAPGAPEEGRSIP
jgi:anti-sigma factor RsiW